MAQSDSIRLLNRQLLDGVAAQAARGDRLRQNFNFHALEDTVQRMLNAMQPGTYVRPHRHIRDELANGFEFFLVLQGTIGILIFDEQGQILDRYNLSSRGPNYGVELPEDTYHALVSLEADSIIFELKEGPYNAATDKEFLPMFPEENTLAAKKKVEIWTNEFAQLLTKSQS